MGTGDGASTIEEIADALRDDPVLVHTALGNGRTAEVHAALTDLAEELDFPVYVVLVRRPPDELAENRPAEDLLRKVHARLEEPGLYVGQLEEGIGAAVAYDVDLGGTAASALPPMTFEVEHEIWDRVREHGNDLVGDLGEQVRDAVHLSAAGQVALELHLAADPEGPYDVDALFDELAEGPWFANLQSEPLNFELDDARSEPLTDVVAGIAATIVVLVVGWRVARAVAAWRAGLARRRQGLAGDVAKHRRLAQTAITRLERDLQRALRRGADLARTARAEDHLRAARHVLDSTDHLDVIGAEALAGQGRALLAGGSAPYRPCFFDPRHGAGGQTVRVKETRVPACRHCQEQVDAGRAPETLKIVERGRVRPYYEGDSVWARTGFGALDDQVAARVLEGVRR
ncbi:hypothetical protein J2S59_002050 [Nocardioides massiliensis]|uniref:Uncharacterized protein n=1 Tax=Nocardioides massiliensis TaxID=1325935 RepID=A0ABT9NPL2_9ACTN|nr:hypothetical protein [Nocardioides massiliensis]MDP9822241.1 hypothetical protein [Nocardioides massiliensis]